MQNIWDTKLYAAGLWIYRLAFLNILWVLSTLVGLLLFGIMPATIAMFIVIRKLLMDTENTSIFKMFFQAFRQNFIKSNLLGFVLMTIGSIIFFDIKYFQEFNNYLFFLNYFFIFLLCIYFLALVFIFPVYAHFEFSFFQYIKHAVLIVLIKPLYTFFILLSVILIYILMLQLPITFLFFGITIQALIIMWGAMKITEVVMS